jgi:hypothetical protein
MLTIGLSKELSGEAERVLVIDPRRPDGNDMDTTEFRRETFENDDEVGSFL